MKYISKPSHCITLNLRYLLPLSKTEQATLHMYDSLWKDKELIEVLGSSCRVVNITESTRSNLFHSELKVDIKLQQILKVRL